MRRMILTAALAGCLAAGASLAADELALGATGPDFNLKGTDGQKHSLDGVAGEKGTAVIFTCNTCPYSQAYEERLITLARDYQDRGIGFVAINANDPGVAPGDSFDEMVKLAEARAYPFPYLVDTTQEAARAYGARVTPHVFLLDASGALVYRGRVDSSVRPEDVKEREFADALDAVASGQAVPVAATKAFGCSIKWSRD